MQANQHHKANGEPYVACGRPVNELLSALERITGHREPPDVGDHDPPRGVFLGETPEEQAQQRALFEERRRRWESWWSQHRQEFVTPEELRSVERPRRDEDLVEMAGVARYGVRFPTGPEVRLGPVRMLRLTSCAYRDGKSYLDFDTGRGFGEYEGMKTADWGQGDGDFGSALSRWHRQTGIDVRCQGPLDGVDLHLWMVDDSRWDTLEAEIRQGGPLRLGREATSSLVRFESSRIDFKPDAVATFLFTTREGGAGSSRSFRRIRTPQSDDEARLLERVHEALALADSWPAYGKRHPPNDAASYVGIPQRTGLVFLRIDAEKLKPPLIRGIRTRRGSCPRTSAAPSTRMPWSRWCRSKTGLPRVWGPTISGPTGSSSSR